MSGLSRATALIGLPVVTFGGDDVAEIRDVVYSEPGRVDGFTLNRRGVLSGSRPERLPWSQVGSVGRDAVMIESEDALVPRPDAPAPLAGAEKDRDVLGVPVIDEQGNALGRVHDVVVRLGRSARVIGYELEGPEVEHRRETTHTYVPLPDQVAVSGDAVIIPDRTVALECSTIDEFADAAAPSSDSEDRTYDELYAEARRRDVPGRSTMSKRELAGALAGEGP